MIECRHFASPASSRSRRRHLFGLHPAVCMFHPWRYRCVRFVVGVIVRLHLLDIRCLPSSEVFRCLRPGPDRTTDASNLQELAQLGLEDTVGDELSLLGDLSSRGHFCLMTGKRRVGCCYGWGSRQRAAGSRVGGSARQGEASSYGVPGAKNLDGEPPQECGSKIRARRHGRAIGIMARGIIMPRNVPRGRPPDHPCVPLLKPETCRISTED